MNVRIKTTKIKEQTIATKSVSRGISILLLPLYVPGIGVPMYFYTRVSVQSIKVLNQTIL